MNYEMSCEINSGIARIEDLPYYYSPPVQFSLTQKGTLTLGQYPFTGGRATMEGGVKNLTDNTVYYIKSISFSADIPLIDYQQALKLVTGNVDIPSFYLFIQSDSNSPVFSDPILLQNYFSDQEFKQIAEPKNYPNRLSGFFRGTLQQTGALAGISEINLTMQLWVQFIDDDNFVEGLKRKYPRAKGNL